MTWNAEEIHSAAWTSHAIERLAERGGGMCPSLAAAVAIPFGAQYGNDRLWLCGEFVLATTRQENPPWLVIVKTVLTKGQAIANMQAYGIRANCVFENNPPEETPPAAESPLIIHRPMRLTYPKKSKAKRQIAKCASRYSDEVLRCVAECIFFSRSDRGEVLSRHGIDQQSTDGNDVNRLANAISCHVADITESLKIAQMS